MNELFDILDEKTGKKTGEVISKDEAHLNGAWHGTIHVLIVNPNHDKTLLQKRSALKPLYPNTWDIAVGGHIDTGEDDITAAKRELSEELGLDPLLFDFKFAGKTTESLIDGGIICNEWVSIFVVAANIDINSIKLQEEEVSEIKWCTKKELNDFIENKNIIPHKKEFEILNKILSD